VDRQDSPRLRTCRTSTAPVACDPGRLARRQPVSPAAQLQRLVGVSPREYAEACRLGKVKRGCASRATSPPRCSTRATDRAAGSTSARFRSSAWRRRSIGAEEGHTSSTRSSIRPMPRWAPAGGRHTARRLRRGDGLSDADLTRPVARISRCHDRRCRRARRIRQRHRRAPPYGGRGWTCRSTCRPPRSSGRSGRRWRRFPRRDAHLREVAASIGRPRAVRAVPVPARRTRSRRIPCHRVVRPRGTGGYRWGGAEEGAALTERRGYINGRSRHAGIPGLSVGCVPRPGDGPAEPDLRMNPPSLECAAMLARLFGPAFLSRCTSWRSRGPESIHLRRHEGISGVVSRPSSALPDSQQSAREWMTGEGTPPSPASARPAPPNRRLRFARQRAERAHRQGAGRRPHRARLAPARDDGGSTVVRGGRVHRLPRQRVGRGRGPRPHDFERCCSASSSTGCRSPKAFQRRATTVGVPVALVSGDRLAVTEVQQVAPSPRGSLSPGYHSAMTVAPARGR
jgi:hypothetical protein